LFAFVRKHTACIVLCLGSGEWGRYLIPFALFSTRRNKKKSGDLIRSRSKHTLTPVRTIGKELHMAPAQSAHGARLASLRARPDTQQLNNQRATDHAHAAACFWLAATKPNYEEAREKDGERKREER